MIRHLVEPVHHDVMLGGTRVLTRGVRPEDAALYPEFV